MNRKWLVAVSGLASGLVGLLAVAGCSTSSRCDVSGHACTWLGVTGQTAFTKDGQDRLSTSLYWTMDTLFAHDGTVWFIDWNNHLVRRVMTDGTVVSVVGWTDPVFPGDGDQIHPTAEYSASGAPGSEVQLNHPTDLHELADGTILVMAWHNHKLRKIDPATGQVWIVSGAGAGFVGDGGPASAALYKQPSRLTVDEQQNIYIIDQQNERVRKIDARTQIITTVAGNGTLGFSGDAGPAVAAALNFEVGDNPEPAGGIIAHGGALYLSDTDNNRIRRIDLQTGTITTIAGTGAAGDAGDGGPAVAAMLNHPRDLEIGPEGDLYLADTDNSRIRAIDLTSGTIRTVAGNGKQGFDLDDDRPAIATQLNRPFGIDFDRDGNLYISDTLNSRILRVAR